MIATLETACTRFVVHPGFKGDEKYFGTLSKVFFFHVMIREHVEMCVSVNIKDNPIRFIM